MQHCTSQGCIHLSIPHVHASGTGQLQCPLKSLWLPIECISMQLTCIVIHYHQRGGGKSSGEQSEWVPWRLATPENLEAIAHPMLAIHCKNSRCKCWVAIAVYSALVVSHCLSWCSEEKMSRVPCATCRIAADA